MKTKRGNKKLMDMVGEVLDKHPFTRNSDIQLCIQIWGIFYEAVKYDNENEECVTINDLVFVLPHYDSIARARRVWQEKGYFLPTEEKIKKIRKTGKKIMVKAMATQDYNVFDNLTIRIASSMQKEEEYERKVAENESINF